VLTLPEALAEIERLTGVISRNNAKARDLRDEVIRLRAENAVLRERKAPRDPMDELMAAFGKGRR